MEAAAVDGGGRPGLRPDRLRRDCRRLSPRRPQQLPRAQRERRHRRRHRSTTSRFAKSAIGRGRGASDAQLVDRLSAAGAKRIFFDINFSFPSNPATTGHSPMRSSGPASLAIRAVETRTATARSARSIDRPLPILRKDAQLGLGSVRYNYQNAAWHLPYAATMPTARRFLPSPRRWPTWTGQPRRAFRSIIRSKPRRSRPISAADILNGRIPARHSPARTS